MLANLKIELMRRKITQTVLARAVGISNTHMSRIIRGDARCRARLRRAIAQRLGVRETQIFPRRGVHKRESNNSHMRRRQSSGGEKSAKR